MTTKKETDVFQLTCSVVGFGTCNHQVTWLFQNHVVQNASNVRIHQSSCAATMETLTNYHYWNQHNSLCCHVTVNQRVEAFPYVAPGERHVGILCC